MDHVAEKSPACMLFLLKHHSPMDVNDMKALDAEDRVTERVGRLVEAIRKTDCSPRGTVAVYRSWRSSNLYCKRMRRQSSTSSRQSPQVLQY